MCTFACKGKEMRTFACKDMCTIVCKRQELRTFACQGNGSLPAKSRIELCTVACQDNSVALLLTEKARNRGLLPYSQCCIKWQTVLSIIIILVMVCIYRNHNLQTSKAPLKSQAWGTSLFTSAVLSQKGCFRKSSPKMERVELP